MNKKATLIIVQGFIASGKTTFSKNLSLEIGAIHLNIDEWVTKLFKRVEYTNNWNECFDKTTNFLWQKTKEYLINGYDVIFDMGFWYKKDRIFAKKIANECNANFRHYYLLVPDEILKQRIIQNRPKEWAKIHLNNFDKNKELFEIPSNDENVITINNYK